MLVLAALAPLALSPATTGAGFDHSHAAWTKVLRAHVEGDRFDYGALRKSEEHRELLDGYLASLHAVTPAELAEWTEAQRYAFWINVYNAHVVDLIVDNYPLESIEDLSTRQTKVWKKRFVPMGKHHPEGKNEALSLDVIEHGILRPVFEDARVHAAVNCASISCPPLRGEAFVADRLEAQLDEQMRAFLADEDRNRFDPAKKELALSALFQWFANDFERDAESVVGYVRKYGPLPDADWIAKAKVRYLDYDWGLNDVEDE